MSRFTYVVEHEDGKEPAVSGGTNILGGRLCYVSFDDIRDRNLTEAESEALQDFMSEHADDFKDWCTEHDVEPEAITEKIRSQAV